MRRVAGETGRGGGASQGGWENEGDEWNGKAEECSQAMWETAECELSAGASSDSRVTRRARGKAEGSVTIVILQTERDSR